MHVYILRCESSKYYVGISKNVHARIQQHFDGNGSYFTGKYLPTEIMEIIEVDDPFDEDKFVKKYMLQYGIENVRGGAYCKMTLSRSEVEAIKQELNHIQGRCYKCGETGHFRNTCKYIDDRNEDAKTGDDFASTSFLRNPESKKSSLVEIIIICFVIFIIGHSQ
eukprot:NODE_334_length_9322_cov_0.874458.p6 type:complete len:165 gc:universal NODE_334_length_9322_cov_0.874458:5285-5779(+)